VEYFNYLSGTVTGYGRCTREIKSSIATEKSTSINFFQKHIRQKLRQEISKTRHLCHNFDGAETLILGKADHKNL
jgi:hypothetical protein